MTKDREKGHIIARESDTSVGERDAQAAQPESREYYRKRKTSESEESGLPVTAEEY